MYVCRDAVDDAGGMVGRSRRRPRGETPALMTVVCNSYDGVVEGLLAIDDLLGHGGACAGGDGACRPNAASCLSKPPRFR